MSFAQRLGIFCLILITAVYVYFAFFSTDGFGSRNNDIPNLPNNEITDLPPIDEQGEAEQNPNKQETKTVKIYVTDSKGNLRPVNRKCDTGIEKSCFAYSITELIKAPTEWEKSKGLSSEIPVNTKILSVREGTNNILIDLSSDFESGGGAESTYIRVHQIIKTARANTNLPVYLYINGKQADVIGGEGIMIKQPLSERSLDE